MRCATRCFPVFLVLGDLSAALIGISFGKIKIGKKSLEGAVCTYVCSVCVRMFALCMYVCLRVLYVSVYARVRAILPTVTNTCASV